MRIASKGYSLAEVLIAIAVLAIGIAGVTAAVVYGTRHADSGARVSESTEIARTLFEEVQASSLVDTVDSEQEWPGAESGLGDNPQTRRRLDEAPFGAVILPGQYLTNFRRRVTVTRLGNDPQSPEFQLARVEIEIFWSDPSGEHRTQFYGVARHARS